MRVCFVTPSLFLVCCVLHRSMHVARLCSSSSACAVGSGACEGEYEITHAAGKAAWARPPGGGVPNAQAPVHLAALRLGQWHGRTLPLLGGEGAGCDDTNDGWNLSS